jgi:DNA invertase Pin-like site-specific DNA recombinase
MTKAFAYLRVSGKGQVDGDGFERQLAAIKAYAKANDIKIVDVFREEAVSGTLDSFERPAWIAMLNAILSNGVRAIIVEKCDRLARSAGIQEYILMDMQRRGIRVISADAADLETDDPMRILFRQVVGAIAQYEKAMIVLRLRGARRRIRERDGRCEGRKPYGTREGEDVVLAAMRNLRASGFTFDDLAAELSRRGHSTRTGKPWRGTTVRAILART